MAEKLTGFQYGEIRNETNSAQNKDLKGIYNLIHDFTIMSHIFKFATKNPYFMMHFLSHKNSILSGTESKNSYSDDPQSMLHMDSHYHVLKFWPCLLMSLREHITLKFAENHMYLAMKNKHEQHKWTNI